MRGARRRRHLRLLSHRERFLGGRELGGLAVQLGFLCAKSLLCSGQLMHLGRHPICLLRLCLLKLATQECDLEGLPLLRLRFPPQRLRQSSGRRVAGTVARETAQDGTTQPAQRDTRTVSCQRSALRRQGGPGYTVRATRDSNPLALTAPSPALHLPHQRPREEWGWPGVWPPPGASTSHAGVAPPRRGRALRIRTPVRSA